MQKKTGALVVCAILASSLVTYWIVSSEQDRAATMQALSSLFQSLTIPSSCAIIYPPNIAVYSDSGCTVILSSIDWGEMQPGEVKDYSCWVKNIGEANVYLLSNTTDWEPPVAAQFITLHFCGNGTTLPKGAILAANFTLSVSPTITGITDFSFNITISATGVA